MCDLSFCDLISGHNTQKVHVCVYNRVQYDTNRLSIVSEPNSHHDPFPENDYTVMSWFHSKQIYYSARN